MQSNSDVETSFVNRFKVRLHGFGGFQHLKTGLKSARRHLLGSLNSEYRQNSVAHVVVDHAAVSMNNLTHPIVIAVERMDKIVGEQSLGKSGESTNVDKEDRHVFSSPAASTNWSAMLLTASSSSSSSSTSLRTVTEPVTRVWQASRIIGLNWRCVAISTSAFVRGLQFSSPSSTAVRQVEHRALLPQA
jgi:hypothetical protein